MSKADSVQSVKPAVEAVAIVGAGLGGLAAAIALEAQGIQVQLYEKARELKPIGAGLSLFPNGLNTLEAISPGLVQALVAAGSSTALVNLKKENGDVIAQTPMALREQYHQPMLDIRWSRLQEILATRLPKEIIHLNHRCIGFQQRDNQVEIEFEGQQDTPSVHADLLIGADGIHSVVRQVLIGDGSPRYAGRLSWRAVIPFHHPTLSANEVTIMTGADGKIFTLLDVGEGFVFWSAAALSTNASPGGTPDQVKQRVLATFAQWAEPVTAIVEATPAAAIVERPICDRPPLQHWSQGRVTLLGDAAHAMVPSLGQGANMAFEDAWELSQCLVQHSAIDEALTCYEQRRIQRTQLVQAYSAAQGSRSYDPDGATFLQSIIDQSKVGPSEFDHWLYGYQPLIRSACT